VEARCSGNYAREVTALHHGQLVVHIGEADGTLVPRWGRAWFPIWFSLLVQSSMGGFTNELHSTGTEPPQAFERDRAEGISRAVVVGKVVPARVVVSASRRPAAWPGVRAAVRSALHSARISGEKKFLGQIPRRFLVAARGTPVGDEQMRDVSRAFARSPPESPRCEQKASGASGFFWV
jgi:hypothetical protein